MSLRALVTRLDQGGFGEVWLARDRELGDRPVAIKMMLSHMLADPGDVARFQREMRLTSRMQHPKIMTVFTTGRDNGVPFMVMEYLKGSDLGKKLSGWPAGEVARIGRETCSALAYAHGLDPGVVHRDIKPGNLFVCETGLVKVTDFGIAKAVSGTRLTLTGTVIGSLPYMAPEQWMGEAAAFSIDIWAVGCVLYELLSGKLARSYVSPTEYVAAAARRERVPPLPGTAGVPAWLSDAVMAMLQPDPLARPTAAQCVQLLSGPSPYSAPAPKTQTRQPGQGQRPSGPQRPVTAWQGGSPIVRGRPASRRKLLIAAGAAVLVIGGVATALSLPGSGSGSGSGSQSGDGPARLPWSYSTGQTVQPALAAAGSTVYASDGATVYALNAATGHLAWSYDTADDIGSSPAVAGSTVYVSNIDGSVDALNAATG